MSGPRALAAAILFTAVPYVAEAQLTLDELYASPQRIGTAPTSPVWSPDGSRIAFLWNDAGFDPLDVRGSWGHGRGFRRGIRLAYGGLDVEDIESGVRYLETLGYADTSRVGIWGSSYGGLLTIMSLLKKPGLFRAGVAGAPATNVFHAMTGEMRVMMAPQDETDAYEAASAITHAEGLRDRLLIIHGMRDRIVLYKDTLALVERLMELGKNVDLVTLPDGGHAWDREELYQTRFAFKKLVEYFDRYVKAE